MFRCAARATSRARPAASSWVAPHVHLHPDDAAFYGVEPGGYMHLRIGGACAMTFDRVLARVSPAFKLEVHIDTDEGNACGLAPGVPCELLP